MAIVVAQWLIEVGRRCDDFCGGVLGTEERERRFVEMEGSSVTSVSSVTEGSSGGGGGSLCGSGT